MKKILKNLLALLMIFVALFVSYFAYFGIGYKYYNISEQPQVLICISKDDNLIEITIAEYLQELQNSSFTVANYELNFQTLVKKTVIDKRQINDNEFKNNIIKNIKIDLFLIKLTLKDNSMLVFKTEEECNNFIKNTNQKNYTIENIIGNINDITKEDIIQQKINEYKAAEEAKRVSVSRSGGDRQSSKSTGAPLASYHYISSKYGMRNGKMHTGVDFAADYGTNIYAWKSGIVTIAEWNGSYGKFIEIKHNDGTVSRYAHLSSYNISCGDTVVKGQKIGGVGSTGNSTGNHLHWEIKVNGDFVNPLNYI